MNDKLLVSAIIPTYNYGHFVTEAVASVLAQTYRDIEVIVVDDGSTDDTRERLAPFMDRLRYIHQSNQGLSAVRNTGIRAARADWLALLDSDDVWHPRKLEAQMRYLAVHSEVALLASQSTPDIKAGWSQVDPERGLPSTPVTLADCCVVKSHFAPSTVVVHKKCFDQAGLFDTELRAAEDRDMWIRSARYFSLARLDLPLCWYRYHGGNMSAAAVRMEINELKMLRKTFASVVPPWRHLLLWLKSYSYAYYNSVYLYGASRRWLTALDRFLRSVVLWPLPYHRSEVDSPLARPRMLAVLLLRMLRIRRAEPMPRTQT